MEKQLEAVKEILQQGEYDSAISVLYGMADEFKENTDVIGKIYIRLGTAHCIGNSIDAGLKYYKLAFELGQEQANNSLISKALLGLGAAYHSLDSLDKALHYYSLSIPLLEIEGDTSNLSGVYSNLGLIQSGKAMINDAYSSFKKALFNQAKSKDSIFMMETFFNLGMALSKSGLHEKALVYLDSSRYISHLTNSTEGLSRATRQMAIEYYYLDNFRASSSYFFSYDSIGHDLFHQSDKEKILELETKFKTAEIERDNAFKQAEIAQNKRQLLLLSLFALFLTITAIAIYLFLTQRRKRLKIASEKQIQGLLQEQEMKTAYALLEGQDRERKRIAAELHDNLGSILVTLNMYADALQDRKPEEMKGLAEKIGETAKLANDETRKISHSLDSGLIKHFGLEATIKQLTEAVSSARNLIFHLSIQLEDTLGSEFSLEIYRIIQELINNTLKHSKATKVHLELTHVSGSLNLIFEDNGIGFNKDEIMRGMGLKNIENRVQKLDGELTIDSSPGKGSTFIIEIAQL
ncbi:MAG: sensor histidine kinase [Ekhidna sp.]|uniref:sensor histidine kinase n=1 Tax=Ekhidna sp. TaxID=2608089 RepID=UPI0032EE5CEC